MRAPCQLPHLGRGAVPVPERQAAGPPMRADALLLPTGAPAWIQFRSRPVNHPDDPACPGVP